MMIIAWFSCGITSAVACKLALIKYGLQEVEIYYIDIKTAHPDNERFIRECEAWYGKEIKLIKSSKYIDQFDVIEKERYINGPDGAPCSKILKKQVRFKLQEHLKPNLFDINKPVLSGQIFGFEFTRKEINRAVELIKDFPHINPLFPLIDEKLTKKDCAAILKKAGIGIPKMYLLGYNNNNCIGCVKGGAITHNS